MDKRLLFIKQGTAMDEKMIKSLKLLANGKAGNNLDIIRQELETQSINAEPAPENSQTCPNCDEGMMTTILITDGYGNVIADNLADETYFYDFFGGVSGRYIISL